MTEQEAIKHAIKQANLHSEPRYVILDPTLDDGAHPIEQCYVVATPEQESTFYYNDEVIVVIYPDTGYKPAVLPGMERAFNLDGLPLFDQTKGA